MAEQLGPQAGERIYLLDISGLVHRLFHAVPLEFSRADPELPINVVIGLTRQLRRLRRELDPPPKWALAIFDAAPDGGWRAREFPGYKAGRPPQDEALAKQWPLVEQLLDALGINRVSVEGCETDDLIASYTEAAVLLELEVVIVSSDKDLLHLVRGEAGPKSVRTMTGFGELELRGPEFVSSKFGVGPERLGDLLALAGDSVDGIPGCPGIGIRRGAKLIAEHDSLERLIDRWSFVKPDSIAKAIHENVEQIRLSRRLVELRMVEIPLWFRSLAPWGRPRSALDAFFGGLGFPRFEAAIDRYNEQ